MKLAMFTTKEQYLEWLRGQLEYAEKAHKLRIEEYEMAKTDKVYRRNWMAMNHIDETRDDVWAEHLDWMWGAVKCAARKISKIRRQIRNVQ